MGVNCSTQRRLTREFEAVLTEDEEESGKVTPPLQTSYKGELQIVSDQYFKYCTKMTVAYGYNKTRVYVPV